MARFIAFDWGKARTGIAVSDKDCIIASPHSTVPTEDLHSIVEQLVNEEPCKGLVVGVPGLIIGTTTDSSNGISKFINHLNTKYPDLTVHQIDESETSSEALEAMISGGLKKSKRREKGSIDKVAATLILQRFLQ